MLWLLIRTVSMNACFEHPKQMFRLMDKKIFTILRWKIVFILTCAYGLQVLETRTALARVPR